MLLDIDLDEVEIKPLLPPGQPFTFGIKTATQELPKKPNKNNEINPYLKVVLVPLEDGWQDREVNHYWSLSIKALQIGDPVVSIKQFFLTIGRKDLGKFSTEDLQTLRFVGDVKYDEAFPTMPKLAHVLRGA